MVSVTLAPLCEPLQFYPRSTNTAGMHIHPNLLVTSAPPPSAFPMSPL